MFRITLPDFSRYIYAVIIAINMYIGSLCD